MRILFDHNTPAPLRHWLSEHQVEMAFELTNGALLEMAESAGFEVMVTTDKGIRYQQNRTGRVMALLVIDTNDWTRIRNWKSVVMDAFSAVTAGVPYYLSSALFGLVCLELR